MMDTPGSRKIKQSSIQTPAKKLTGRPWPLYDDKKHRWDEFKARTMNMALRAGFPEDEIAQMLHDVLPDVMQLFT